MEASQELNKILKEIDSRIDSGVFYQEHIASLSLLLGAASLISNPQDFAKTLEGLSEDFYRTMIGTTIYAIQASLQTAAHSGPENAPEAQ